jgi:type VI secretion system protein
MFKERLLERVFNLDNNPHYRMDAVTVDAEIKSVMKYIQNILSTKQGSAVISFDFGIPDITNFHDKSYGQYIKEMEGSLEKSILRFEPRLNNVQVIYDSKKENKSVTMHFKIEAEFANSDIPVVFETTINPDGKVAIYE